MNTLRIFLDSKESIFIIFQIAEFSFFLIFQIRVFYQSWLKCIIAKIDTYVDLHSEKNVFQMSMT